MVNIRQYLVDFTPLRESASFRRIWVGYVVNQIGSQMTVVAIAYQMYHLTGSSLDVGLISLAQVIPIIASPLAAGAIADYMDRRLLLLGTNLGGALCSLMLAVLASLHSSVVWPLYLLAAGTVTFTSADAPIRTAFIVSLVDRKLLTAANVLRTTVQQTGIVLGPAVAGLLLGLSISVVYWIDVASFMFAFVAVLGLPKGLQPGKSDGPGIGALTAGFRFASKSQPILGCLAADLSATMLGTPQSLFPAIAAHNLHGGPVTLGLLYAAPGSGALLLAVFSGWTGRVHRTGLAVVAAIIVWGSSYAAFGLARQLWLALMLLALAGASNGVSAVFRNTIVQFEAPNAVLGRVTAIQTAVAQVGPRLGNTEAGIVADAIGPVLSIAMGGVASALSVLIIAALAPKFRNYVPAVHTEMIAPDSPQQAGQLSERNVARRLDER